MRRKEEEGRGIERNECGDTCPHREALGTRRRKKKKCDRKRGCEQNKEAVVVENSLVLLV